MPVRCQNRQINFVHENILQLTEPLELACQSCEGKTWSTFTDPDMPIESEWIAIDGGTFEMGAASESKLEVASRPQHRVSVPCFAMMRNEVTFDEYEACVDAGVCAPASQQPASGIKPVTGVNWLDSSTFCRFVGGRFPTEAEWEFAARNRGKNILYPWGHEPPTCDVVNMEQLVKGGYGCGTGDAMNACNRESGNTEQGLCDMAGNVAEWTQDLWHDRYDRAPEDGSAWLTRAKDKTKRVVRGGHWKNDGWRQRIAQRKLTPRVPHLEHL